MMYFITNQEDYIVAASKSFLDKIGYRDVCNISLALKNKEIIVLEDDSELKVSTFEKPFKFNLIELHSAFGKLNLYQLNIKSNTVEEVENENIAYLKRIKDGLVETQDNDFNIPDIKKETVVTNVATEPKDLIELDSKTTDTDTNKSEDKVKIKEYTTSQETKIEVPKKVEEKVVQEDNLEVVKIFGNKDIEDSENKIEVKDYSTTVEEKPEEAKLKEEKPSNEALLKIIDELPQESDDKNLELAEESDIKENNEEDTNTLETLEKLINLDTNKEDEIEESTEKKSGLSKFKSKLFPWGKKDEEIELEEQEEETNTIKTANELKSVIEKSIEEPTIDKNQEVTIEHIKEDKDTEEETKVEVEPTITEDKLTLEEEELLILKDTESAKKDLEEKSIIKEEAKVDTTTNESASLNSGTIYKLIGLQVNSINIEENAKKLSIDKDNYKLLLENYLDEIDNYKKDLENGNKSTIDMLTDASNLLSLDLITNKLQNLSSSDKKENTIKEITLITSLIREKLEGKESIDYSTETLEVNKAEVIEEDITPNIPQDVIEISNAQELLNLVSTEQVSFNPQRAASDLNLPESLILEFVNDFVKQSKEHLSQLVNAYKNDDIKTLQTTAHMLKGAASNLRLDTIADNLFKIQKENSVDRSGELIKEFVAKLKGLESETKKLESINNEN